MTAGITRFLSGYTEFAAGGDRVLLASLAVGQEPDALIIACSDSRVIPEQITGADPGTLFVVRNVGNLVPPANSGNTSVAAAVAYALGHLGVRHLIVLGHYRCGAMAATRDRYADAGKHGDPAIDGWLAYAEDSWRELEAAGHAHAPDWHDRLVEENVLQQLANALEYPAVRAALDAGRLALHAWIFDLARAELRFWDPVSRRFTADSGTGEITAAQVADEDAR